MKIEHICIYTKKKHFIVTLESPLDSKEIKPVNPKGNLNIHWKDWCWSSNTLATSCEEPTHWKRLWWWAGLEEEKKGTTEDEMVGRHHQVNGHEFEQAPEVDDGEGCLACRSPWGRKESDTTEWVNNYSVTEWSMLVLKHFLTTRKRITLFK